jgi:hypothetical protein
MVKTSIIIIVRSIQESLNYNIWFFRCQHHYHKDCVHEWLGLNSKCPLCKRDFRGKDYQNSIDDEEEEEQY